MASSGALPFAGNVLSGFSNQLEAYAIYNKGQDEKEIALERSAAAFEDAKQTRFATDEAVRRIGILGDKSVGSIRASYGASGVQSATGSALDVIEESAKNVELDKLWAKYTGEMQARKLERESGSLLRRGLNAEDQANTAAAYKSTLGLLQTLLGVSSNVQASKAQGDY